jgi:hypothetical protein
MVIAERAEPLEEAWRWRHHAHVSCQWLHDECRDTVPVGAEQPLDRRQIVIARHQRVGGHCARHAGAGRHTERGGSRAGLHQERVAVAVVTAGELDDTVSSGGGAGQT